MDYTYNYEITEEMIEDSVAELFVGALLVYLIVFLGLMAFSLAEYIFGSFGLYTIAKRLGREYPWLAFIPFARTYLHGELAGNIPLKKKTVKNPGVWMLALPFIVAAISGIVFSVLFTGFIGTFSIAVTSSMENGSVADLETAIGAMSGFFIGMLLFSLIVAALDIIVRVLRILVNHQIFMRFTTKNMSIVHAVLCVLVPLYEAICLFVMRKKPFNPGMEPRPIPPVTPVPPVQPAGPVPPQNQV